MLQAGLGGFFDAAVPAAERYRAGRIAALLPGRGSAYLAKLPALCDGRADGRGRWPDRHDAERLFGVQRDSVAAFVGTLSQAVSRFFTIFLQ